VKAGYVYIMANKRNGTLYIGVTSNLRSAPGNIEKDWLRGFTRKHGCKLLVWYEAYDDLQEARLRELQMKRWKRQWKLSAIELMNPDWQDLYPTLI
jgi:putative endonuclease